MLVCEALSVLLVSDNPVFVSRMGTTLLENSNEVHILSTTTFANLGVLNEFCSFSTCIRSYLHFFPSLPLNRSRHLLQWFFFYKWFIALYIYYDIYIQILQWPLLSDRCRFHVLFTHDRFAAIVGYFFINDITISHYTSIINQTRCFWNYHKYGGYCFIPGAASVWQGSGWQHNGPVSLRLPELRFIGFSLGC